MSDDFAMRLQLQKVVAYRELCRSVRRSGRENVFFALILLLFAYLAWENGNGRPAAVVALVLYGLLALGELFVGLFKWLLPSAEGVLLDGIVLLVFVGYNFLGFLGGVRPPGWAILLGLFMLWGAIGRFKAYGQLRRMFAQRPSAEHMAWFDDLVAEIRAADPQSDELALDLPTDPHWKGKLLGTTVFFVATRGHTVLIAGPHDFEILREKADRGTGRRKALFSIYDVPHPEFEIADASWANYQKWRIAYPLPAEPTSIAGNS
ncbi:MAG: hypothetical protein K8U57_17455 [Planctomycetes bacterium]|nr:hypothetical protein [Planctomycetota bacterium]